jgi:hypothetical protein
MKLILFSFLMASSAMAQNALPSEPPAPSAEECSQRPVYYCSTQGQCCEYLSNEGGYSGVSVDPCSLPDYGLGCDSTDPLGAAECFCN